MDNSEYDKMLLSSMTALIKVAQFQNRLEAVEPPFKDLQRSMVVSNLSTHRPINIEVRGEANKSRESVDFADTQNKLQFISYDGRRSNQELVNDGMSFSRNSNKGKEDQHVNTKFTVKSRDNRLHTDRVKAQEAPGQGQSLETKKQVIREIYKQFSNVRKRELIETAEPSRRITDRSRSDFTLDSPNEQPSEEIIVKQRPTGLITTQLLTEGSAHDNNSIN